MLDRSAVGQLSSLSSRTKWQRLPVGDTLYVADLSNIRPSQWSGLFDRWAVEHAPDISNTARNVLHAHSRFNKLSRKKVQATAAVQSVFSFSWLSANCHLFDQVDILIRRVGRFTTSGFVADCASLTDFMVFCWFSFLPRDAMHK